MTTKLNGCRPWPLLKLLGAVIVVVVAASSSFAQVPLSAYTDRNGYINVQALTCAAHYATHSRKTLTF